MEKEEAKNETSFVEALAEKFQHNAEIVESGSSVYITSDESGMPTLKNYDALVATLEQKIEDIKNYDYQDDDRVAFKHANAAMNKLKTALNTCIKMGKENFFAHIDEQNAHVKELVDEAQEILKTNIDASEQKYRQEKKEPIEQAFQQVIMYKPVLKKVRFDDVFDARWLNRTVRHQDAVKELNERLDAIAGALELQVFGNIEVVEICSRLANSNWNAIAALQVLDEERAEQEAAKQAKAAQDALAREQKAAAAKKAEEKAHKIRLTLLVDEKDVGRVKSALLEQGINYEIV